MTPGLDRAQAVTLEIPDSALRRVASYFDAATVRHAIAYARDDRVHPVKPPPWPAVARVRASDGGHVVTVDHNAADNHLRGDCSRPSGRSAMRSAEIAARRR